MRYFRYFSDELGDQLAIIKQSIPSGTGTTSVNIALELAKVEVVVNNSIKIPYTESKTNLGYYYAPKDFAAEPNKTYQLLITTAKGQKFQSKIEKLTKGSLIKNVYQKLILNDINAIARQL